jgi:hypothetical protein
VFSALAFQIFAGCGLKGPISARCDQERKIIIGQVKSSLDIELAVKPSHEVGKGCHHPLHSLFRNSPIDSGFLRWHSS